MVTESVSPNFEDDADFEHVFGIRKAHTYARRMSDKYPNASYDITGKPGINENYLARYENGIMNCPEGMEFVGGHRKMDGTYVHPFCRKKHDNITQHDRKQDRINLRRR